MTSRFSADFLDLLTALNDAEAKYMLVGGHAVGYYGLPRATKDFDLWIEASTENAGRVLRALHTFGAPLGHLREEDLATPDVGFRMGSPPYRIELLTKISGVDFETCWARRRRDSIEGIPYSVIDRDDLIANKRAAGRPQDLADVAFLERTAGT
jgi:hypothetical protein